MKSIYKVFIVSVLLGIMFSISVFADGRRSDDHIGAYSFRVEIDGVTTASFESIDGLESITEVIEFRDGDDSLYVRKVPGRTKYSNIVLKRGFVNTDDLWIWRAGVVNGVTERKSGSIVILDRHGDEVSRFNFYEAWPVRWKLGSFDGTGDDDDDHHGDLLVEELEIAVELIERA